MSDEQAAGFWRPLGEGEHLLDDLQTIETPCCLCGEPMIIAFNEAVHGVVRQEGNFPEPCHKTCMERWLSENGDQWD